VHIHYYLRAPPDARLTLDILSADGQTILRSFSGEDTPGQPGAPRLTDDSLDPWQRDDGPIVLRGTYQACLTVSGHSLVQPFTIVRGSRPRQTTAALAAELESLKGRLIDVHYPEAQPPQQGREVLDDLSARLDTVVSEFDRAALPKLHALNEAIRRAAVAFVVDEME
jgi:hypothetical protein